MPSFPGGLKGKAAEPGTGMTVREICVSVGHTINLGDYNSGRVDFTAKATLDEPVEPNSVEFRAAFKELSTRVNRSLSRTISELYPDLK